MTRDEIKELFDKYGPMVLRRSRSILGNESDAEEAAQEVFIRAIKGGQTFEKRSQVSTWLYKITTNYCLNQLRNQKRRRELWQTEGAPVKEQLSQDHPEVSLLIRRLLHAADETQAKVAIYVYIDGMSHAEVAKLLGVSRRTVGNILERFNTWARKRLADSRDKENDHG